MVEKREQEIMRHVKRGIPIIDQLAKQVENNERTEMSAGIELQNLSGDAILAIVLCTWIC